MRAEYKQVLDNVIHELESNEERLDFRLNDVFCEYLKIIPQEERDAAKSELVTLMAYKIIKNAPDFDMLLKNAENEYQRENALMLKDKYYRWMVDNKNRKEKNTALKMIFDEIFAV